jgi:hypothetical protein
MIDELRDQLEEMNLAMNELSELLVTSTGEPPSTQALVLNDQFGKNAAIRTELDRRRTALDQLQSDINTLQETVLTDADLDSVKGNLHSIFED